MGNESYSGTQMNQLQCVPIQSVGSLVAADQ